MALGLLNVLRGDLVGGVWIAVIGLFLNSATGSSYTQLRTRQALEGQPVHRFMTRAPVAVAPNLSLRELVDNYIYVYGHDMYPVVDGNRVLGSVGLSQIKHVPQSQWPDRLVREIMSPCSAGNMIDANADAVAAIAMMQRSDGSPMVSIKVAVGLLLPG